MGPVILLLDHLGNKVQLGPELARGGEGAIYRVTGNDHVLAKIYLKPPDYLKTKKLQMMAQIQEKDITKHTAWPISTLHSSVRGPLKGFLMPRIDTSEFVPIHELHTPSSRLASMPDIDWRFLVNASLNVALAFHALHRHEHVIGDVNNRNTLVSKKTSLVRLIDCDSFQIKGRDGHLYTCDVGVEEHTPPELQGKDLKGSRRTADHDSFGLAVCVFQLLFMGRHPYGGVLDRNRFSPTDEPAGTGEAIKRHLFAYGANARSLGVGPPPASPPFTIVTQELAQCFERAFAPPAAGNRPSDTEWIRAIGGLVNQVRQCPWHSQHFYLSTLGSCPWCALEQEVPFQWFGKSSSIVGTPRSTKTGVPTKTLTASTFDIRAVWAEIEATSISVTLPAFSSLPVPASTPTPESLAITRQRRKSRYVGSAVGVAVIGAYAIVITTYLVVGAALGVAVAFAIANYGSWTTGYGALKDALSKCNDNSNDLSTEWKRFGNDDPLTKKLEYFRSRRSEYDQLGGRKQQKLREYEAERERRERLQHLRRHRISEGEIQGVGQKRTQVLQAHGVLTAADVDYSTILAIPGFGDATAQSIVAWRRRVESLFRLGQPNAQDRLEHDQIEQTFQSEKRRIEHELSQGKGELALLVQHRSSQRDQLLRRANALLSEQSQANANLRGRPFP